MEQEKEDIRDPLRHPLADSSTESTHSLYSSALQRSQTSQSKFDWDEKLFYKPSLHDEEHVAQASRKEKHPLLRRMKSRFMKSSATKFFQRKNKVLKLYLVLSLLVWVIALGAVGATIGFWLPQVFIPNNAIDGINITALLQNLFGTFVISIGTSFSTIKYQYTQTYLMYDGWKQGFGCAFTTFGDLIVGTGRLLLNGKWYLSLINLGLNIILSIATYQLGQVVARRWKPNVRLSKDVEKLTNPQQRMEFEFEKLISSEEKDEMSPLLESKDEEIKLVSHSRSVPMDILAKHFEEQLEKRKQHSTATFTLRHRMVIGASIVFIIFSFAFALVIGTFANFANSLPRWLTAATDPYIIYDYCLVLVFAVSGAVIGGYFSERLDQRQSVQWGTFKVNMISCILIGIIHTSVVFQSFFPMESPWSNIFLYRFVTGFCGSLSNFGGLIDETMRLWNSKLRGRRYNAVRNLFYNFFLCLLVYLLLVVLMRLAVFFRYWSADTAAIYFCDSSLFISCK